MFLLNIQYNFCLYWKQLSTLKMNFSVMQNRKYQAGRKQIRSQEKQQLREQSSKKVFGFLDSIRQKKRQIENKIKLKTETNVSQSYLDSIIAFHKSSKKHFLPPIKTFRQQSKDLISESRLKKKIVYSSLTQTNEQTSLIQKPLKQCQTQISSKLSSAIEQTDFHPESRTKLQVKSLYAELQQNQFFRKIDAHLSLCLLRTNKIVKRNKNQYLYKEGEKNSCMYIILEGMIYLSGSTMVKKLCPAGDTLNEEVIFNKVKRTKQDAKSICVSYLLEIKGKDYSLLQFEIKRHGFLRMMKQMELYLKSNYQIKQRIRLEHHKSLKNKF